MAKCSFCEQKFRSDQAVKAHLRFCSRYQPRGGKQASALGLKPKAGAVVAMEHPLHLGPTVAEPDESSPMRDFIKVMSDAAAKPDQPLSAEQRRRQCLQEIKRQVVDQSGPPHVTVTITMRGAAKATIERELRGMALEELPPEERYEIGAAIRDRVFAPAFKRQAEEAERRDAKKEAQRRADLETFGNLRRADRRKQILIQQASHQAQAYCEKHEITGWAQLSVVGDIEARLGDLLSGDEAITEAKGIVQCVLEARFQEAEATLAAAKAKEDAKWHEDMIGLLVFAGLLAIPLVVQQYPLQAMAFCQWLERTFGLKPAAEPEVQTRAESEPPASATSAEARPSIRRRPKAPASPLCPEPPWGNPFASPPGCA